MRLFVFGKVYLLVMGSSDEDEEQRSDDKWVVATVHMEDTTTVRMRFCGLLTSGQMMEMNEKTIDHTFPRLLQIW